MPVWAKPNSNATIMATIDFDSTTKLGSTSLTAGQYDVVAEGNQAKFEREDKIVAVVPCVLKELSSKARHTEFLIDHDQLTEIQVSGKTQAIELSTN